MPRRSRRRNRAPEESILQTCLLCNLPDSSEMVSCDKCAQWFHFECVGVNANVANRSWSCPGCSSATDPAPRLPQSSTPSASNPGEPHIQSTLSPPPAMPITVPPVPHPRTPTPRPRSTLMQNPPPPTPLPRTPIPRTTSVSVAEVPEVRIVDQELPDEVTIVERLPADLRLQFLEQQEAIEQRYLLRRFQLLLDMPMNENSANLQGPRGNVPANQVRDLPPMCHSSPVGVNQLPPPPTPRNRNVSPFVPISHPDRFDDPSVIPTLLNVRLDASTIPLRQANQQPNFSASRPPQSVLRPVASSFVPPPNRSRFNAPEFSQANGHQRNRTSAFAPFESDSHPATYNPSAFHDDPTTAGGTALLNRSQLAARHAVPKELPVYTGEPEEWPLFYASFENTTHLCGFTAEENMVRLRKCLQGKALEAVKCQLLHPSNLDQVIATLKMLFGRPEIIVHSLLQKINGLPAPKAERLGTLVDFALAVRNMEATVKACELEEHLCNLTLLHSLCERLPPMIRLNWATHRQSLRSVTLSEFSDWLYKLAEAASTVTMPQFSSIVDNKPRRGRKEDGFLNAHTETAPKTKQLDISSGCLVCQGSCATVDKCKRFLSFSLSARWDALREHKLCRGCLTTHRGPCKSAKVCGKSGCQYKHHRLLHNDAKSKPETSSSGSQSHAKQHQQAAPTGSQEVESCNTHRGGSKSVLFQYIPIVLYNNGIELRTHAFLDSGSSLTLMEESLAKQLDLNGEKSPLCLVDCGYLPI
ncbi:uncharacterized protein LOC109431695 [Aedes albopictus]|uniref:PHD-type domain-containing protein n=1 Tax=Aedes albopictus TaxID=7160 RepID=A0ABM1Z1T5_AEDAL